MISLSKPYINGKEIEFVTDAIQSNWLSTGKYVSLFESKIGYNAIACNSGTSGLHIALLCMGIGKGDKVIVPTLTFISPVNAIRYVGAEPVFMDCDDNLNIDVNKVREYLKDNSAQAILPVHVFGTPCDMESIINIAKEFNLKVIEDAAEAVGSECPMGDVRVYSFNANKIITCGGGGAIVSKDKSVTDKARYLINQAKSMGYTHDDIGYNYTISNVHAAIGCAQFDLLEDRIAIKKKNFKLYAELDMVSIPETANHWFYALVTDKDLIAKFRGKGIQVRSVWPLNHLQKPYLKCESYKIEKAYTKVKYLNLPCGIDLTETDIQKVIGVLK